MEESNTTPRMEDGWWLGTRYPNAYKDMMLFSKEDICHMLFFTDTIETSLQQGKKTYYEAGHNDRFLLLHNLVVVHDL